MPSVALSHKSRHIPGNHFLQEQIVRINVFSRINCNAMVRTLEAIRSTRTIGRQKGRVTVRTVRNCWELGFRCPSPASCQCTKGRLESRQSLAVSSCRRDRGLQADSARAAGPGPELKVAYRAPAPWTTGAGPGPVDPPETKGLAGPAHKYGGAGARPAAAGRRHGGTELRWRRSR